MKRLAVAFLALAAACAETTVKPPGPAPIDECTKLPPLALSVEPSKARVNEAVALSATGGSGRYTFSVAAGGSGGEVRGARFVAGPTPATDTLTVTDDCKGTASATLQVVPGFSVQPTRATVKPGVAFTVEVVGAVGAPQFKVTTSGSGGTMGADGRYTAGASAGLDLITVKDLGTGQELLLQYTVSPAAQLRGAPGKLALPTGASVPLELLDGSGQVTWAKRDAAAPGTLANGTFTAEANAPPGPVLLEATDAFTGEKATVEVTVLEELKREVKPRGRLSDFATTVVADFDGDGFQDLALGVPESDLARPQGGAVFIFKGSATGLPTAPTWTITGSSDTAQLGAVLAAGDLDGDGKDDLAISEPGADVIVADSGAVLLYRFFSDGPRLLRDPLTGLGRGNFGAALAIADVDNDGDKDLIVGSPGADLAASGAINSRGVVDIFLLQKGATIPDLGSLRIGGADLAADGAFRPFAGLRFGRALVVADLNADGKADLASFGQVNNTLLGGAPIARSQSAVAVHFGRGTTNPFDEKPDLYVLPTALTATGSNADGNEGTYRLGAIPAAGARPPLLMLVADRLDSPDLTAMGGVRSGSDCGGVYLYDLTAQKPSGAAAPKPVQLGRDGTWARLWGDAAGIAAGRSFALGNVDGVPGDELVLGAPYAAAPGPNNTTLSTSGKLLVYSLAGLTAGAQVNKPLDVRFGLNRMDALGVAAAVVNAGGVKVAAFGGRASSAQGDFTGRLDVFSGAGALAGWTATSANVPAGIAAEGFGAAVEVGVVNGAVRALVGAPGYSGPGTNADGNEPGAGRAYLYAQGAGATATIAQEGAASSYLRDGRPAYGGRTVGADVAMTDFDGDGRKDLVIAAPNLSTPPATSTDFATLKAECAPAAAQSNGGVLVRLAQADGTFKEGFRLWGLADIAGCTPAGMAACRRTQLSRNGVVGGFDFNKDGKEDLAVTRSNGLEVFLGRAPDDASLGKPTMGCDSAFSLPFVPQPTSALASLGDLNGDGCADLSVRYSDGNRSGVIFVFGFDPGGACGPSAVGPSTVRLAADNEVQLNNVQLGVATARAGSVRGGSTDYVAVSAALYPVSGVVQPAVLLFETARLVARRQPGGNVLVAALGDGVDPIAVTYQERAPGFGRALAGNVDLTGDGVVDLVVSAPGASVNGDGTGAVFVLAGGPGFGGPRQPWLTVVGDGAERGNVGQDLSVSRASGAIKAALAIGAPTSYRTGTSNGTAWLMGITP